MDDNGMVNSKGLGGASYLFLSVMLGIEWHLAVGNGSSGTEKLASTFMR